MADLSHVQKTFVVIGLAQFMTPSEVVEAVREEFDVEITRQQVRHYNPQQSSDVGGEWKKLFDKERKKFIASSANIAISHSSVRLRELDFIYRQLKTRKSWKSAAQLLEQAAKERGGQFTNTLKAEHTGKDGGPIRAEVTPQDTDYRNAAAALAPKGE